MRPSHFCLPVDFASFPPFLLSLLRFLASSILTSVVLTFAIFSTKIDTKWSQGKLLVEGGEGRFEGVPKRAEWAVAVVPGFLDEGAIPSTSTSLFYATLFPQRVIA